MNFDIEIFIISFSISFNDLQTELGDFHLRRLSENGIFRYSQSIVWRIFRFLPMRSPRPQLKFDKEWPPFTPIAALIKHQPAIL